MLQERAARIRMAHLHGNSLMNNRIAQPAPAFGGRWTEKKLDILESYLDAYTTALKGQQFELWYIDAFAGTGQIELTKEDQEDQYEFGRFVSGSAERAIGIGDKPFDRLVFVEQRPDRCAELEALKTAHSSRNIIIENADANNYLTNLGADWRGRRGVLFLDPYATQVEWTTLVRISEFEALDMWVLFPVYAISRILPRLRRPEENWEARLNTIYGDESWRRLYQENRQPNLFDMDERERGIDGLLEIYKSKLSDLFGDRFLRTSRPLKNSKNSNLFELIFCAGSPNPRAIAIAKRIAEHILMKDL